MNHLAYGQTSSDLYIQGSGTTKKDRMQEAVLRMAAADIFASSPSPTVSFWFGPVFEIYNEKSGFAKDNQVLQIREHPRWDSLCSRKRVTDLESLLSVLFAGKEPHLCIHVHE
jgi:hypothetical protein